MKAHLVLMMAYGSTTVRFPYDVEGMVGMELDMFFASGLLNVRDSGSHKYIPTDRLNADLGLRQGAGVFGYYQFEDKSFVLKTCDHGLAIWDGTAEGKPEFWRPERVIDARRRADAS